MKKKVLETLSMAYVITRWFTLWCIFPFWFILFYGTFVRVHDLAWYSQVFGQEFAADILFAPLGVWSTLWVGAVCFGIQCVMTLFATLGSGLALYLCVLTLIAWVRYMRWAWKWYQESRLQTEMTTRGNQ